MSKRAVRNPNLRDPVGFSRAVIVPRDAEWVVLSGQIPVDADGRIVAPGDLRAQTVQVMENIRGILEAAGCTMDDIVRLNIFLTDMSQIQIVREVRAPYFSDPYPAMTGVGVTALGHEDVMIEIEAIAVLGSV